MVQVMQLKEKTLGCLSLSSAKLLKYFGDPRGSWLDEVKRK